MTEQSWTIDELDHIGDADELRLAPPARATTLRLVPRSEAGA